MVVLFGQVQAVHGWDLPSTLALLGVYLTVSALRGLFIGPGLESLSGMDGEIWSGRFDFTVLRPVDTQFLVSLRKWRPFALFDLLLGLGVLGAAVARLGLALTALQVLAFLLALFAGILTLYAILLAFAALIKTIKVYEGYYHEVFNVTGLERISRPGRRIYTKKQG